MMCGDGGYLHYQVLRDCSDQIDSFAMQYNLTELVAGIKQFAITPSSNLTGRSPAFDVSIPIYGENFEFEEKG